MDNNRNKENFEKINESYSNKGNWGKDGTTTEERSVSSYNKNKGK